MMFCLRLIYDYALVVCKQVEVLPDFLCRDLTCEWPDCHGQAQVINYMLIEGHSQTFNEGLFLPYCKLYNKWI